MFEKGRNTSSLASTGLTLAIISLFVLLGGCNGSSDNDGDGEKPVDEVVDLCPLDDQKLVEGLCGCGVPDTDTDSDGTPDCQDACPEDPGTIPDKFGFCGDTGDFATVVEGEALTLAVNGAVLTIPADALAPGTTVSLAEIDPGLLDKLPNGPRETRITPIYALEFSEAQLARDRMSFVLDVPATLAGLPYTRVNIEGGLATEGRSHTDWLPKEGSYDDAQSLLTIELGATATRFLIAGLTRASATAAAAVSDVESGLQTPGLMQTRALALPATVFPEEPEWVKHGWIVKCDPERFEELGDDRCDPEDEGFEPMMEAIASSLYASDKQLTALDFPRGRMSRSLPTAGTFPFYYYDPDLRSAATAAASGGDPEYFSAWANPDSFDNEFGAYYSDLEIIQVDTDLEHDPDRGESLLHETTIHELMHAVQRIEMADTFYNFWILEGLASAVEPNAPGYSGPTGTDYRYFGEWRDWKYFLESEEPTHHYEVLEFWLSLTGDMSRIPIFYEWITGIDSSTETNSLLRADQALTGAQLPPLVEAYTNLILTRDGQAEYPHCVGEGEDASEEEKYKYCDDESSCSTPVNGVQPFSAHCLAQELVFLRSCGDGDEPDNITVTLEPSSPNPNMKLIIGGEVHDANTEVDFPNDGKRYWVINTDLEGAIMSPGPTANLVFKNESPPCNLKLLRQRIVANSSSTIGVVPSLPHRDLFSHDYYSFEDDSEPSYREDWKLVVHGTGETDLPEPSLTFVEPIGLGVHSEGDTTSVSYTHGTVEASYYAASGTVLNSTETSYDEASNTYTTVGQLKSLASITMDDRYHSSVRSQAQAQGQYIFETKGAAAELTMTWDCDISLVRIEYVDPNTFTGFIPNQVVFTAGNQPNSQTWECGTRQWMISPNRIIRIIIHSTNYTGESVSDFHNEGGSFEFSLRSIDESEAP